MMAAAGAAGRAAELADCNAVWNASRSAAMRAAELADNSTAWSAARIAARSAQRKQFCAMVDAAFAQHESELVTLNP